MSWGVIAESGAIYWLVEVAFDVSEQLIEVLWHRGVRRQYSILHDSEFIANIFEVFIEVSPINLE